MSTPRNHHYVSQVLIKKFVDSENNLYTYSKTSSSFEEKILDRFDFAEKDLNSTITASGEIDHKSVEDNLNKHIENDFNKHYDKILASIASENYSELNTSMEYLMRMGVIGDMRTPQHQIEMQNSILGSFRMLYEYASDELKAKIDHFENRTAGIKNKLPLNYKEISDKTLELMGEKIYSIFNAPQTDFFFLPDCSSVVIRSQLEEDNILDGEVLKNENRPIGTIIFPINSKLIIIAQSAKICPQTSHGIYDLSTETVVKYNKMFLETARDKVICKDKAYLKQFIGRHVSNM
ncbi:MAG: DUF4238 domain-containing protein [Sphingobacteriaceae bacterium]|nr:DUF4238 domain-containing protein [Sphingobacteriaceae bacterium]